MFRPAFLVLLLPACVSPRSTGDSLGQLDVPTGWQAGTDVAGSAPAHPDGPAHAQGWWQDFRRPALTAAIEEAQSGNWDLAGAGYRVRAAAAEARIATGGRWPALNAGVDLSRSRRNFIGLPVPGAENGVLAVESESHALSLQLSWEADLWGRLAAGERAAVNSFQAAESDLQAARLSLAGMVTKAWFALGAAGERLELAHEEAGLAGDGLDIAQARFRAGRAAAGEIHALEAALSVARQRVGAVEQERKASARALELLLGRYPAGVAEVAGIADLPPAVPAGLPAEIVARRPDLQAADARLRAQLAQADQAEAALYPRLSLTATGGTSTAELSDLLNGDFKVWSLAAGLTAPVFQAGQLRAGLEASEALAEAARAAFLQSTLVAFSEVEGALLGESLLREQLAFADRALAQARSGHRSAERRFASGQTNSRELLEARGSVRRAKEARLGTHLALMLNRVDLYLALGGGFSTESR